MTDKKGATIFDFVDGVTSKKKEWKKWSETDQSKFSPFIVNRWLSMRQDLTEIINELQTYTIGLLRPRETYRLYHELLPSNKAFAKYIKGKKEDKYSDKLIAQVAEHYKVSKSEASDYVELLDQTTCTRLLSLYGYSEAEIKTMIKGVRK
jgi:predicted nucleic acid-binding protein